MEQPDRGESVFMPIVNLYYKTDLSSYSRCSTASNGGRYIVQQGQNRRHTDAHTVCSKAGSKQRPVSIALYLRSFKLNDLLHPLGLSNKLQH